MKHIISTTLLLFFITYNSKGYTNELSSLINEALNHNYKIINSQYEVESSAYNEEIASTFFYPTINATANTTWNDSVTRSSTPSDDSYNSNGYNITISQTLLDMSKFSSYEESIIESKINTIKHNKIVNDIIIDVVVNYFSYLKYNSQKKATDAQLRSSEFRLKQINRNYELGNLPKTDTYETLAQKETTYKSLSDIRNKINISLIQLNSTTQTPTRPSYDVKLSKNHVGISNSEKLILETKLISSNYDIIISKFNLEKSKKTLKKSKSSFSPKLSVSANYGYNDSNLDGSTTDSATYALNIEIPIFSGGSNYYDYKKNENKIRQYSSQYEKSINDSKLNFEELIYNINSNVESLNILRTIIKSNYLVYNGNKKAFKLGTKTLTDLLNSESRLYDTIRDYHSNQYDYIINIIKLSATFGSVDLDMIEEISNAMIPTSEAFDISDVEKFTSEYKQ